MSGAILLLPLYAFMICSRPPAPLPLEGLLPCSFFQWELLTVPLLTGLFIYLVTDLLYLLTYLLHAAESSRS